MDLLAHCYVWRRKSDGKMGAVLQEESAHALRTEGELFEVVEMVPASQLRGAVQELDTLRGAVREAAASLETGVPVDNVAVYLRRMDSIASGGQSE